MSLLVLKLTGLDHAQSLRDWIAVVATFLLSFVTVKVLYSALNYVAGKTKRTRGPRESRHD